ncbi:hypothetical protein AB0883_13470 [Micromonospora sp. NPDC047812]|uniref:hypothetical protein n=1 Tax=Micromonospora sp. NPDC047812 TaxID=3155742 RepID=UPI003452DC44
MPDSEPPGAVRPLDPSLPAARTELLTLLVLLLTSVVLLALCYGCAAFWLYN